MLLIAAHSHVDGNALTEALAIAVEEDLLTIVKALMATGLVDLRTRRSCGKTLLHIAVTHYSVEYVRLLLASGEIDVNARDDSGATALHNAGSAAVVRELLAGGADVNAVNADGKTVLHLAGQRVHWYNGEEVLQAILNAPGVDLNASG